MANLSKSKYITYCQCPKALWLKQYKSEEMVIDPLTQARFDAGTEVGELAKRLFGNFVEATTYKTVADETQRLDLGAMAAATQKALAEGAENIAEAAFIYDGCYCAVDLLHKTPQGYAIYEVKSSTDLKELEVYAQDVAYQKYVLTNCGLTITGTYLVNIDNEYVLDGTYDVKVALSAFNKCYTAYTPTGEGNTKVPMIVKDISDIAIDHVKPIDLTLRELDDKGRIPNLKIVSESFRDMMGRPEKADKDIEDESLDQLYNNVDISKLTDELNLIRTDGVLRLMVSEYNGKKSNSTAYDKMIKIKGKEEYLGLLGEALLDDETIYLYQRLNERNAKTRASREEPKGTKVKISQKIINLI